MYASVRAEERYSGNPIRGKMSSPVGGADRAMRRNRQDLPQIHLVELLDAGGGAPAAHQAGRASGLARRRKARLDLLAQALFDVALEGRLQAAKAPRLGGFVRRPGLRERQRVARARPRRIQRDASDYTVVGMKAVWDVGVESEDDIGFRGSDLAHELFSQLEVFDQLGVGVAQESDPLDSKHVRGQLLLALPNARHL